MQKLHAFGLLAFLPAAVLADSAADGSARDFAYRVQPILSDKCFHCHGPDEAVRPTDLRLDTQEGVLEAFAGGDFEQSEAWRRITATDETEVMPPPEMHKPFSEEELAVVRDWMEGGATWSTHWAFGPPQKIDPPGGSAAHPIDAFVDRKLAEAGVQPMAPADRAKRFRRLKLDLHGLPPTLGELDEFLGDTGPGAWRRAIDRLLASPRYGERMAVAWLDGARYADTNGYQNDFTRTMWPWRDWVINAFSDNKPFDEFTIEQIAGDMLPGATRDQRLATAFNRNHRTVTEAGSIEEEWLVENVVDRVETTSAVWLGLTMGCARCHDHKYDPITQAEFYEFFAFFHNVDERGVYTETRGNVGPTVEYVTPDDEAKLDELVKAVAAAEADVERLRTPMAKAAADWFANATPRAKPDVADAAIALDADGWWGVRDGERVVAPAATGEPPKHATAFLGGVADFQGDVWREYPGLVEPATDRPLSISAWVKHTSGGAILSKMNSADNYRGIDWFLTPDGKMSVHFISVWTRDAMRVATSTQLPKDQWAYVTVTYDGSAKSDGVRIYFGDDQQPTTASHDKLEGSIHTDEPFRLGRRSGGEGFNGWLGRVRITNRVIGEDEIAARIGSDLMAACDAAPDRDAFLASVAARDSEAARDAVEQYALLGPDEASADYAAAAERARVARQEERAFRRGMPSCMVMKELPEPRKTFVLNRGEYDKPDPEREVTARIPRLFGELSGERNDRLALAEWLVSRENPLTARVIVNRLWAKFFGVGLVKSIENFGVQSDPPSHPDLLDWLAVEFIDSGWDLKHLIRLIVTSDAYQRSSSAPAEAFRADPDNRLLARGPRRRLQAEFVRDNALALSGLLARRIGGPSVFPYQPDKLWDELAGGAGQGSYKRSDGDDLYRRSLYTYRKRTVPHPTMSTFDAPSFEICTVYRSTTNTPLQALALLNDTTYVEAARKFGERVLREGGPDADQRVRWGFRLATSREASDREAESLAAALARYREAYESDPAAAEALLSVGEAATDYPADRAELAAYAMLGSLLLNLDETITVE